MKRMIRWVKSKLNRRDTVAGKPGNPEVIKSGIYVDEQADTLPNISFVDPSPTDTDESTGLNPYDTGVIQKK